MTNKFTVRFQRALCYEIETILSEDNATKKLEVGIDTIPANGWHGRPDIWIRKKARVSQERNYNRVLAIEIEHISHCNQAMTNAKQVVSWVRDNVNRKAGLIHLYNFESKISGNACEKLFNYGYQNRSRRFNYDFRIYHVNDNRACIQLAKEISAEYAFQALLRQHLLFLDLVE